MTDTLDRLYTDHHGWLCAWLKRKLSHPEDAADLAQDTFLKILVKPRPQGLREPRAYLTTIAHGLLVDRYRRRDIERAYLEAIADLPEPLVPSAEEQASVLEALLQLDALLDRLKPKVRQAFLLAQLEGQSCPEIARTLGVSRATVERYIAQALRHCYRVRYAS